MYSRITIELGGRIVVEVTGVSSGDGKSNIRHGGDVTKPQRNFLRLR